MLEDIFALAAQHKVPVELHVHLTMAQGDASKETTSEEKRSEPSPLGKTLLAALANGEMRKAALIEAAFGEDFTDSQGRQVTRELSTLRAEGYVTDFRHGWWRLND